MRPANWKVFLMAFNGVQVPAAGVSGGPATVEFVPAAILGNVHGRVRIAEQGRGIMSVARKHADSQAARHKQFPSVYTARSA